MTERPVIEWIGAQWNNYSGTWHDFYFLLKSMIIPMLWSSHRKRSKSNRRTKGKFQLINASPLFRIQVISYKIVKNLLTLKWKNRKSELSRSRKMLIKVDSGVDALVSALTWLHINQWVQFQVYWLHSHTKKLLYKAKALGAEETRACKLLTASNVLQKDLLN